MPQSLYSLLLDPEQRLIDRDLSWLQFNERVLAEAQDSSNPLMERLKFLGIASSNLDEFFLIRFAARMREYNGKKKKNNKVDRITAIRQNILSTVRRSVSQQARTLDSLIEELSKNKVYIERNPSVESTHHELARSIFFEEILPQIETPRYFEVELCSQIRNLQLAVLFPDNTFVLIPKTISDMHWRGAPSRSLVGFFLDDLLTEFLGEALSKEGVPTIIRLARDADVRVELRFEDPETIPDVVRKKISTRERRKAIRLQARNIKNSSEVEHIYQYFKLPEEQVFISPQGLCLSGVVSFASGAKDILGDSSTLFYPKFTPCTPKPFDTPNKILKELDKRDYFFHHPYDSFDAYVNFIEAAVAHPDVKSIEQTVYRVDALSKVTSLLKKAAKKGKFVRIIIEPRARFDEINNITLAEDLRSAGVKICFATGVLKVHAKIALVVIENSEGRKTYTHLSTGNYNAKTAQQYTDMAIITSNEALGADAQRFFEAASKGAMPENLTTMALAPRGLHKRIISLIKQETTAAQKGEKAYIFAKVNALVDPKVVEALYTASQAGVEIDLVVRGACSLVPGVTGLSENIRVMSIVDRFLEHSRIYYFRNANKIYLSSADWMPRNFFSRLEIAFPILDERIIEFIGKIVIPIYLSDKAKARSLTKLGIWRKWPHTSENSEKRSQFSFKKLANQEYQGTPLEYRGQQNTTLGA